MCGPDHGLWKAIILSRAMPSLCRALGNILLLFILFAVCGWIYEVIWTYFDDGVWTNRGFLFGPWLPIYGFGGMLVYAIFRKQITKPVYTVLGPDKVAKWSGNMTVTHKTTAPGEG